MCSAANIVQKLKFSLKDFLSKCEQKRNKTSNKLRHHFLCSAM